MKVRYQDLAAQSTDELFTALLVGVGTSFSVSGLQPSLSSSTCTHL